MAGGIRKCGTDRFFFCRLRPPVYQGRIVAQSPVPCEVDTIRVMTLGKVGADRAKDERIVFYSASFFKIDGVTLTIRGLIAHIVKHGGRVLVLTADDPTDKHVDAFVEANPGASVLRVTGGLVPAPGADYYMGLYLTKDAKRALEDYNPTVVHITNPDLVALWVRSPAG